MFWLTFFFPLNRNFKRMTVCKHILNISYSEGSTSALLSTSDYFVFVLLKCFWFIVIHNSLYPVYYGQWDIFCWLEINQTELKMWNMYSIIKFLLPIQFENLQTFFTVSWNNLDNLMLTILNYLCTCDRSLKSLNISCVAWNKVVITQCHNIYS